jgi:hypothetical protein
VEEVAYGDLLRHWHDGMETQVNVRKDAGEPHADKRNTFVDDDYNEFFSFRIPRNAKGEPHSNDFELTWPLRDKVESIGSTGWDWRAKRSRHLGYDFDDITGHAAGHGVSEEELARVRRAACSIPWIEVRRSTRGKGIHLYARFDADGVPTANHTEHAALGRAVLGMMSLEAGFDFGAAVDCAGGNMWIDSIHATEDNQGLTLIRAAETVLTAADLPENWMDHVDVVERKRAKVRVRGVEDKDFDVFDALASARRTVPLDATHKEIIAALSAKNFSTAWVPDFHMLQSHTGAFARVFETEWERLALKGHFATISPATDPGTPNCFAFPLPDGGWQVYRFQPGAKEHETWQRSDGGWTTCRFNAPPDLAVAAKAHGGVERPGRKGYYFASFEAAAKAAEMLGEKIELDARFRSREATLKSDGEDRLVVEVRKEDNESLDGWAIEGKKLVRVFDVKTTPEAATDDLPDFDNVFRALISPAMEDAGFVVRVGEGAEWVRQGAQNVKAVLSSLGYRPSKVSEIVGLAVRKAWKLGNLPFHPEYPGGRVWNLGAAQFKVKPASPDDGDCGHPRWDQVLRHLGQDLDAPIREDEWAKEHGVRNGGDYLRMWVALLLRRPFDPLPYIFMFGAQNCGKSTLHEAIRECLVTGGVVSADRALTSQGDFNGELANAVLCTVEETDLSKAGSAYNKLKDWVTGRTIAIHPKRKEVYTQPNTCHFLQCANERHACPIFKGDTRIVALEVQPLTTEIPKAVLMQHLKDEAPRFLRTILDLELPAPMGRLALPVIVTDSKRLAAEDNSNPVIDFLEEHTFEADGHTITFTEFYERFLDSLPPSERLRWSRRAVSQALPTSLAKGKAGKSGGVRIGNRSWEPTTVILPRLVRVGERLIGAGADVAA